MSLYAAFSPKARTTLTGMSILVLLGLLVFGKEGWEYNKVMDNVLFFLGTVLIGIGVAGRAWSLVYISGNKNAYIVDTGPYSLCRNPLYFFSLVGIVGIGFATETVSVPTIAFLGFISYYWKVIDREEFFLRAKFGKHFDNYCRRVPRLIPRLRGFHEPDRISISPKLLRRGLKNLVYFSCFIGLFELLEALHEISWLPTWFTLY